MSAPPGSRIRPARINTRKVVWVQVYDPETRRCVTRFSTVGPVPNVCTMPRTRLTAGSVWHLGMLRFRAVRNMEFRVPW